MGRLYLAPMNDGVDDGATECTEKGYEDIRADLENGLSVSLVVMNDGIGNEATECTEKSYEDLRADLETDSL